MQRAAYIADDRRLLRSHVVHTSSAEALDAALRLRGRRRTTSRSRPVRITSLTTSTGPAATSARSIRRCARQPTARRCGRGSRPARSTRSRPTTSIATSVVEGRRHLDRIARLSGPRDAAAGHAQRGLSQARPAAGAARRPDGDQPRPDHGAVACARARSRSGLDADLTLVDLNATTRVSPRRRRSAAPAIRSMTAGRSRAASCTRSARRLRLRDGALDDAVRSDAAAMCTARWRAYRTCSDRRVSRSVLGDAQQQSRVAETRADKLQADRHRAGIDAYRHRQARHVQQRPHPVEDRIAGVSEPDRRDAR